MSINEITSSKLEHKKKTHNELEDKSEQKKKNGNEKKESTVTLIENVRVKTVDIDETENNKIAANKDKEEKVVEKVVGDSDGIKKKVYETRNSVGKSVVKEKQLTKTTLKSVLQKITSQFRTKVKRAPATEDNIVDDPDFVVEDDEDEDEEEFEENPLEGWKTLEDENDEDKKIIEEHEPLFQKLQSYLPTFMKVLKSQLTDEDKEECIWKVAVLNNSLYNHSRFDDEFVDAMLKMQKKLDFYSKMNQSDFERYKELEDKFKDVEFEKPMKNKIFDLPVDEDIKKVIYRHYLQNSLDEDNNEKEKKWLNVVLSIPWGKYVKFDVPKPKQIMEEWNKKVSGLIPAKEEFILTLTDYATNPTINPKILTLKGVPGCGKTLFVKSISNILNIPVQWIDLAGMNEVNFIKGFAKTWDGSKIGRLVESLINMQSMNGIIVLEEIDKVNAGTRHGKETLDALVPILDRTRNHEFFDNYLSDVPVPLNNIIFIATCNDDKEFPQYLADRLNVMEIEKPDLAEKLNRAHNFMIPDALKERNLSSEDVLFDDDTIKYIIESYTFKQDGKPEEGVRLLKERLQSIIQRVNYFVKTQGEDYQFSSTKSSLNMPSEFSLPFKVTRNHVDEFLKFQKTDQKQLSYFI